jgi:hypothetical protein
VVEGDSDIARVAPDAKVDHALDEREPVQRGVRLDETPVLLCLQDRERLGEVIGDGVKPGRDLGQPAGEPDGVEDQQSAKHLHPTRAAFGRWTYHDVVVAERESGPQRAV